MAYTNPFRPVGNTQLIAATTTASAALQITPTNAASGCRVNNQSTVPVWIAFGSSSVVATLPTTGAPANAFPMAAGGIETFDSSPVSYISAISTSGGVTGQISVTPGFGQ